MNKNNYIYLDDNNNNYNNEQNIKNNNNDFYLLEEKLSEICLYSKKKDIFLFKNKLSHPYENPYNFNKYFSNNINYNNFTIYITYILNTKVLNVEIQHLKKKYGICNINLNNKIIKLKDFMKKYIKNKYYENYIFSLIYNKRIEYLLEHIIDENYPEVYYTYLVNNILKSLYTNNNYIKSLIK